ncbi:ATP-dependent RNA helicase DDX54-like [Physella acuta]|uniref:ATP-dependent RNA helicase DDX54-like n=1 Tax=Physella acuta TaxID=109671 RepID=UPI0027DDA27B|nr:ATP-dependent RNA helicase DDX54-like [Physella acuta]
MGRRKWKAKKLEKKNKSQNTPENKRKNVFKSPKESHRPADQDENKNVIKDTENVEDDSGDEMASARKMAVNKNKKKSGGFQSMGLSHPVLKGILRRGYKVPTPIQRKTIPIILEGKDVVAMARTGSGKTAAFLVPMFEKLKSHSSSGARAMVLAPTRELAIQTLKFTKEIGKFTGLKAAVILGGDKMDDQFAAMHDHPDIIIATPGRLLHILVEMEIKLKAIEYVVFDEADRLFEMGFQDQLQEIIHRMPDSRQTLLFSATLPKSLIEFARAGLTDPTLLRLDVDAKLSENLKLSFLSCRDGEKCALLVYLLKHIILPTEQTVVFAATKHHVEFLNMLLTQCGFSVTYIYSSLDPAARKINAAKFSLGKVKILIVTDLAARGIDVPLLDNVINFHFPAKPKLFVHRVGRVARAGRSGVAYSFLSPEEMSHFVDLHVFLGRPLKFVPLGEKVEDEDGWFGEVPQSLIDDEDAELVQIIKDSIELTSLVKVCSNAYRKYCKSRPAPATESTKRVKKMVEDGVKVGIHPKLNNLEVDEKGVRLEMLNALKNYKPKTTIFEINSTSKKMGLEVMKAKRALHDEILQKNEARRKERDNEGASGSTFSSSLFDHLGSHKRKMSDEADQKDIESVFDTIVGSKSKRRKSEGSKTKPAPETKDKENFIYYRPADYASEKGLSISNTFEREASSAVLDFTNEDENNQNKKKRHWDRKKKKYVTDSTEQKNKKIKTESGNWISASYKSNAYREWRTRNNTDRDEGETGGERNQNRKLTIVGMKKRKWHTKGSGEEASRKQNQQKFKLGKAGGLKSADQILKNRRRKAKIENFQKYRQNIHSKRQGKAEQGKKGKRK